MNLTARRCLLQGILASCALVLVAFSVARWRPLSGGDRFVQGLSADAQERVTEIIQNLFGAYRVQTVTTIGVTNSASATYTNIEARLREASMLMPNRLDLRFGIATALIGQAIQTNSPFEVKMKSALQVYQEIQALDTKGFQAPLLYAAYSRAFGETNASESAMAQLMKVHPQRTLDHLARFRRLDEILQLVPNENPEKLGPMSRDHAIVILGAALETNGTMKAKLIDRLRQGLALARLSSEAPIVVTGGNAKGGITEAYLMGLWLVNQGIATNRLYLEDQARDTVGNAFRSCTILQKLGVTRVTLVTSASHVKRALADFEEASLARGLSLSFSHLVSKDEPTIDDARERVAIYRDVLRTSGIWAYPGIQQ
jgi:uncharacterized SAM-binding protein YcdF (DUF218 family)